jgi:EAL domain-containing protein (putative c-di-GMP-specific phosphodiesterase class I)/GGDEF domain-containing protein
MSNYEGERLSALQDLNLLDTPPSENFDRITRMASQIFGLPIAAVSLTDVDRQWFKSRVGVEHQSIPRDRAPCAQVAEKTEVLVVADIAADSFYRDSNLGRSGIRFYAGAPLITREGFGLGALCVLGTEPREVTEREIGALRDLAAMVMAQIELQHAYGRIEPVSGLPNRTQFYDDMADLAQDEQDAQGRLAVLIDLAETTQIDNLFRVMGPGHLDVCIQSAGRLLRSVLGRTRTIYNVSATQFAFLVTSGTSKEETVARLDRLVSQLQAETDLRFLLTPVAGVVPFTASGIEPAELLQALNSAAQDARQGNKQVSVFSLENDEKHRRRYKLLQDFRTALQSEDQLSVVYQPRMDLVSGRCIAAEVLLRWRHPELGSVSPAEFIPIIEHSTHVRDLTLWVLNDALARSRRWLDGGFAMPVSVNVSAANLEDQQFAEHVMLALMRHGIVPSMLELEVTESAIMKDTGAALKTLHALCDAGIKLSIDDFGTGYSSLSYLQTLPTKVVKIDQSFIRNLDADERGQNLVRSMITLSHDLGYQVVAEGVETGAVRDLLTEMACDEAQGYLFAKPLPAEDFAQWAQSDGWREVAAA